MISNAVNVYISSIQFLSKYNPVVDFIRPFFTTMFQLRFYKKAMGETPLVTLARGESPEGEPSQVLGGMKLYEIETRLLSPERLNSMRSTNSEKRVQYARGTLPFRRPSHGKRDVNFFPASSGIDLWTR